ncbi:pseudouridine synthase [Cytidiella melzeri]|nr:pseudouridine synthase [Cytidiella melzeri]
MDGKPLYDYAREGIPLPRPIEKRKVTVYNLSVVDWKGNAHGYRYPEKKFTDEQKAAVEKAMHGIEDQLRVNDEPEQEGGTDTSAVACVLQMKVSGGTYVRSIVHNVGHAVDSAAHVVTLTRVHQGRFTLEPEDDKDVGEWERAVIEHLEVVEGRRSDGKKEV